MSSSLSRWSAFVSLGIAVLTMGCQMRREPVRNVEGMPLYKSLASTRKDYVMCAATYISRVGGPPVLPWDAPDRQWRELARRDQLWLIDQNDEELRRLGLGYQEFTMNWSPFSPEELR
jgi:hypothetical protein